MSDFLPTCLAEYVPIYLAIYVPARPPIHLPTNLPTYLPTYLPLHVNPSIISVWFIGLYNSKETPFIYRGS
jgi:hypothetical protein